MPRRSLASLTAAPSAPSTAALRGVSITDPSDSPYTANLTELRRQWKWAAFSQFFYTFAPLLSMPDVTLTDVEDDLARSTALYLPRIMHRLLITLTQDRKISLDNWQSALRKQYLKRDPEANPLGPEPPQPSRKHSREPSIITEGHAEQNEGVAEQPRGSEAPKPSEDAEHPSPGSSGAEVASAVDHDQEQHSDKPESPEQIPDVKTEGADGQARDDGETKDWLELPMLAKLDSLHLLVEWQFQNPARLRTTMKSDDETAQWRIEPVGYDAKTNAYWLIGPDRLWIQRVPPKPPRPPKRKRVAAANKASSRASTSKAAIDAEVEEESANEGRATKRKRAAPRKGSNTTSTRVSRSKQAQPAEVTATLNGKSSRAAKVQANKKLDAQAKELAEFRRQAASAEKAKVARGKEVQREEKQGQQGSPSRRGRAAIVGTRVSARLRGAKDEDDWQPIPEEWLHEGLDADRKGKGKGKQRVQVDDGGGDVDEDADAEGEVDDEVETPRKAGTGSGLKTGVESGDEISDLTELSDESSEEDMPKMEETKVEPAQSVRSQRSRLTKPASPAPPDEKEEDEDQDQTPVEIPDGFVEWETICITLHEWEHIAERFEKATHYLEKALYKMLSQHIVPAVTAELREVERKRKLEEAIVHRKRSSRIAIKESEKEEARAAARKKAEEEEKQARAKRQEARAKKEEAEREKRERAREQRRLEREERESRARRKQERDESASVDVVNESSVETPPLNGTHSTGSIQLSRVATPSGVHTPDWMLECEICHKHGVNIDDGLPMVSCGSCSRWQHIPCHDIADQRAGRPKRNWDVQQFYCQRCRPRPPNGGSYIAQHQLPMDQQYYSRVQKPQPSFASSSTYVQPTSDLRYSQRSPYENGVAHSHQHYSHTNASSPATTYSRPQQPHNGALTFAHYQPGQGGFSTARVSQPPPPPVSNAAWTNGSGYPSGDHMGSSMRQQPQAVQFMPQYANGTYFGGRLPTSYQNQSPSSAYPYNRPQEPALSRSNPAWTGGSSSYYPPGGSSMSHASAAESLAHLQDAGMSRGGGWQHAPTPHAQGNGPLHNMHPVSQHAMGGAPFHFPSS